MKFIHEDIVITIQFSGDISLSFELVLEISHSEDDLFFNGFTFDEVQIVTTEESLRNHVPLSFDRHSGTIVLSIMRDMFYFLGLGLGK